ncbi:GATA zinc finger domain-containing protein 14-like [Cephus cinctus]|uniref:GATA zinc finger domain-containing protein 14-like n=1 Tax=Cephus cinctus TaxID=211228 RepID=A0AAJ7FCZ0_CEPCN|nr:GATA zinc finger domain-containing protein 14-like [Cephus cinctus]
MLLVLASLLLAVAAESPLTQQRYEDTEYGSQYPGAASNKDKGTLENLGLLDSEVADELNGKGWQGVVPGIPEKDYPNLNKVPETSFTCEGKIAGGYYADVETRCQVFHVCNTGGVKSSFLCPGGSIFNQKYFVCDWWYDFECDDATELYYLNARNNRGNERSRPESQHPEHDYSSNDGHQNSSVSYNGRSRTLNEGFDLSLAGTGEGASGYTRDKEIHGDQSNVRNIERNENRPSGNYNMKDPGQQISNNSGQDVGRLEERWKNRDKTNENRESHENHSVQGDYDRSIYHSRRKDESLDGYEESPSIRRIFSSQNDRNSRLNDGARRDHFDLNEDRRNFEKGEYLTPGNDQSLFNERSKGDMNFDKGYDKNNDHNSNRFSSIQVINHFRNTVRNHDRNGFFVNGPRSQGENDSGNERGISFFREKFDKSYQQNNHPIPGHVKKTSGGRNIIENENHFGERSSRPGIRYLYPNENEDRYEINGFPKNNYSDNNVNHLSESSRDYRKKQCESSNNIPPELRQDPSKSILTPDNSHRQNAGRTVQRVTGGLQGGIGNGYPGSNRELPGSNAIAGTIAPVLPVESQDVPNDRVKGTGSLNFNGHYPSNEYPSGPPRQETGSPGFGLNANNGYPGIRPNPNTNGILTGQGRTSLVTKTPSGTTSPGEITSISTGYGNGVASTTDNFNEHGDYKGGLQRDETHGSTSNLPPFGKRNWIQHNQGYLPSDSARNEDNEKFVKDIKNVQNNFGKFNCRNGHVNEFENIDYLPPKISGNEREERHMEDRTRYLPAL